MPYFDQQLYEVRCEWGAQGLNSLASSDIVVIVDVLSFTTSVEIAVSRGVTVFPYASALEGATDYAQTHGAQLAGRRTHEPGALSLSPSSLTGASGGVRLVLPSPNGSSLSFQARNSGATVIAGSLRNASAVAEWANTRGGSVTIIPAGERWPDGSLRPAFEDLVGAGAIIAGLSGNRSPEAEAAVAAFESAESGLASRIRQCSSGRELIERGFEKDVELAAELNVSRTVPVLSGDAFIDLAAGS